MSQLADAIGSIGVGIGHGLEAIPEIQRKSQADIIIAQKYKQALAEKEQERAKDLYTFDEKQAQAALGGAQPDYERAATIMRRAQPNLNTYTGRNDEAPELRGAARPAMPDLRPTQRPADAAASNPFAAGQQFGMGAVPGVDDEAATILRRPLAPQEPAPTPEPSTFGAPREADFGGPTDYANPENQQAIQRWANYTPPKDEFKAIGRGQAVYRVNGATGAYGTAPEFTTPDKPTIARQPKQVRGWDAAANGWRYEDVEPGRVYPDKPGKPAKMAEVDEPKIWRLIDARLAASKPRPSFDHSTDERTGKPLADALRDYERIRQEAFDKEMAIQMRLTPGRDPFGAPTSFNRPTSQTGGTAAWAPIIKQASAQFGVPPEIIQAVMRAESGGNQNAVSPVGALGLMQLMPGTAAGLKVNPRIAAQNIMGGAKYLRQLHDHFGGSWEKAIAAYNAGPGAVDKYGGIPPYRETKNYVKNIKADLRRQGIEISAAEADSVANLLDRYNLTPGGANA